MPTKKKLRYDYGDDYCSYTMFTQFKCILSLANNMKHSNGLKWRVNVVLKPGLAFECLIIKRSYESHGIKIEVFLYPFLSKL